MNPIQSCQNNSQGCHILKVAIFLPTLSSPFQVHACFALQSAGCWNQGRGLIPTYLLAFSDISTNDFCLRRSAFQWLRLCLWQTLVTKFDHTFKKAHVWNGLINWVVHSGGPSGTIWLFQGVGYKKCFPLWTISVIPVAWNSSAESFPNHGPEQQNRTTHFTSLHLRHLERLLSENNPIAFTARLTISGSLAHVGFASLPN